MYAYLHMQLEQTLDHSNLSTGGCCVQGGVPSFVLTADLSPLIHQQAHYIQMTCRGTPTQNVPIKIDTMIKWGKKTQAPGCLVNFFPGSKLNFLITCM